MNIRNTIIKHYKKFFDLHAKGIALTEDDHLNIDWAESLVKDCFIPDVSNNEVAVCEYQEAHNGFKNFHQLNYCPMCGIKL